MSRAAGIVADAVAEVIAAQLLAHLDHVTDEQARIASRAAVAAIRADGWHITALPLHDTRTDTRT